MRTVKASRATLSLNSIQGRAQGMKQLLAALVLLSLWAAARAQDVVRVADIGVVPNAPFYLGIEKGYFKDAGLEVQLEKFASAVNAMAPVSTGEVHVVAGGVSPGLFKR